MWGVESICHKDGLWSTKTRWKQFCGTRIHIFAPHACWNESIHTQMGPHARSAHSGSYFFGSLISSYQQGKWRRISFSMSCHHLPNLCSLGDKTFDLTSQQYRVFACILLADSVWLRRSPCLLVFFSFFQTKDSSSCVISASHLIHASWMYTPFDSSSNVSLKLCLYAANLFCQTHFQGAVISAWLYSVAGALSCSTLLHSSCKGATRG